MNDIEKRNTLWVKMGLKIRDFLYDGDPPPYIPRSNKEIGLDYIKLFVIAGLVIALDQWSKYWIRTNIQFGFAWNPIENLAPFFRFVNWSNSGAAFGLFQKGSLIFTILAVLVSGMILIYYAIIPEDEKVQKTILAIMMGGAIGNLVDRLLFGEVTDFIAVGNFPVFNVADSAITVGTALMILVYLLELRKEKPRVKNNQELP